MLRHHRSLTETGEGLSVGGVELHLLGEDGRVVLRVARVRDGQGGRDSVPGGGLAVRPVVLHAGSGDGRVLLDGDGLAHGEHDGRLVVRRSETGDGVSGHVRLAGGRHFGSVGRHARTGRNGASNQQDDGNLLAIDFHTDI